MTRHRFSIFILIGFFNLMVLQAQPEMNLSNRLKNHLKILTSDSLEGRGVGTRGAAMARNYIAEQFRQAGVEPIDNSTGTYLQSFDFRTGIIWSEGINVVGIITGTDPLLNNEYIVLGAHYDHLGFKLDNQNKILYPGADDNASGTAAIIELARYFASNRGKLKRSLIIVAFDAEESGLIGSTHFVQNSPVPLSQIKLMLSFDMVGMLAANNGLILKGKEMLRDGGQVAMKIAQEHGIRLKKMGKNLERRTDTAPFGRAGIPAVHVFTGTKSPYHKPGDVYSLLDYDGMESIVMFSKSLISALAEMPALVPDFSARVSTLANPRKSKLSTGAILYTGSSSHLYRNEFFRSDPAISFAGGLFASFPVTRTIGLQQEVIYDLFTSKIPYGTFRQHSLLLPLSLQFGTPDDNSNPIRIYLEAGVYYGFNFLNQVDSPIFWQNNFRQHEWGMNFGMGLDVYRFTIGMSQRSSFMGILTDPSAPQILKAGKNFFVSYKF